MCYDFPESKGIVTFCSGWLSCKQKLSGNFYLLKYGFGWSLWNFPNPIVLVVNSMLFQDVLCIFLLQYRTQFCTDSRLFKGMDIERHKYGK